MNFNQVVNELDEATKELKSHNDLMDERDLIRSIDEYIARMKEFRKSIHLSDTDIQPRPDNVGLICANFVYHNGARK